MTHATRRVLAVWIARLDNAWLTVAAESVDGTWSAWTAPKGNMALIADFEVSPDAARETASLALTAKTGHTCSVQCSPWELHTRSVGADCP